MRHVYVCAWVCVWIDSASCFRVSDVSSVLLLTNPILGACEVRPESCMCVCVCSGKGGVEALQHSHDVLALAYRPDGKLLASATLDGQIYLWDPQEAQLLVSLL